MTQAGLQHFTYEHVPSMNGAKATLFVLHGTGGNQYDMLPLVAEFSDRFQIVSLLGNVRESGMARFFVRQPSGAFDEASIHSEAEKLQEFVIAWCNQEKISAQDTAFVGYSNGANMIVALAQLYPDVVSKAVILHGLLPLPTLLPDLTGKHFLVTYGQRDIMIPPEKTQELVQRLEACGAQVETVVHAGGHEFRGEELEGMREFLSLPSSLSDQRL